MTHPRQTQNPTLDLLRTGAALMVLAVHAGQAAGLGEQTRVGGQGVLLFFILSGYLTMASLDRRPAPGRYYLGRVRRILPLYWLVVAVRWALDAGLYLAGGMPAGAVFGPEGPCGPRYLRYLLFLQMWLPSDNWALWNNRSALWTMSAFAFFYLLAPWLYRLLAGAGRRWRCGGTAAGFCLLAAVLAGKGMLGRALEQSLGRLPAGQVDNISQFSAQNPVMELYVFLYGALLFFAVREGQALAFGGFCLLLPLLTGFTRVAFEGVFAALVLLAVCLPCPLRPESRAGRALRFFSGGSFFLYLAHPLLLSLLPALPAGSAAGRWAAWLGVLGLCLGVCYLVYGLFIRRFEALFAGR